MNGLFLLLSSFRKMKHYKYDKIRRFERAGRGHKPLLDSEQEKLFKYAVGKGYLVEKNDAIRNRKEGLYYEVLRYFDEERLRTKMYAEERRTMREAKRRVDALKKACAEVLPADYVDYFETISDVGSIKIDGNIYSNFYGKTDNCAEVCVVDFDAFKKAKILTKRQIFEPSAPLSIVKFDAPKTINVSLSDVDESAGVKTIDNACGFAIWTRKLKIFTVKEDKQ